MVWSLRVGLIGSRVDSVVDGHIVIDWGGVSDNRGDIASNLWGVDRGGVIHWLHWSIGSGGGGVAIHSSVDWSSMMDCVVDRSSGLSLSFGMD